jgi:hypothetical protein
MIVVRTKRDRSRQGALSTVAVGVGDVDRSGHHVGGLQISP